MSPPTPDSIRECFTDFAIQEYVMGRLDSEIRSEVEVHFNRCKECASCHNQYELEREFISKLLNTPSETSPGLCVSDEMLAQFLDNSLNDTDRTKCESHLAGCSTCQQELLEMYDEVKSLSNTPEQTHDHPKPTPQGLILRMPERKPGSKTSLQLKWPIDEAGSA
ncbi:MAG: hypothetical protein COA73_01780 [Candidatus Hydrogenedentota bacterium]|nr:MAG: hypothetical protein COA73_01780 [Candidatus Hydrogenedentota bacterium]